MSLSPTLFAIALVLLWFPRAWMRKGAVWGRHSRSHHHSDWHSPAQDGVSLAFRREFAKARNYYDFLRAAVGTCILFGSYGTQAAIMDAVPRSGSETDIVRAIQVAVLGVGLLVQLIRWERHHVALTAPVFYLAGVTIGLSLPVAGMSAFIIAWLFSPVVSNPQGFLCIQSVVFVVVGLLFRRSGVLIAIGALSCFLPVIVSLLARRPLVVFSRRGAGSGRQVNA